MYLSPPPPVKYIIFPYSACLLIYLLSAIIGRLMSIEATSLGHAFLVSISSILCSVF